MGLTAPPDHKVYKDRKALKALKGQPEPTAVTEPMEQTELQDRKVLKG